MKTIDLSGKWRVYSKDRSVDTFINLPGSSCEACIGEKREFIEEYTKAAVRAPLEKYEYIGELFYEREIDIPKEFEEMNVSFYFERVNIASELYIDGVQVGRKTIGLSTPHIYDVTKHYEILKNAGSNSNNDNTFKECLVSGRHTITVMVDNTDILHIGDMASGYSVDTGGYWNGIIGRMEVIARPGCYVESAKAFLRNGKLDIETVTVSAQHVCCKYIPAKMDFEICDERGKKIVEFSQEIELYAKRQRNHVQIDCPKDISFWDEFNPIMYVFKVSLSCGRACDSSEILANGLEDGGNSSKRREEIYKMVPVDMYETKIGVRSIKAGDRELWVNDRAISLRGTINCAQYPLTGYPPMDEETWLRHLVIYKEYGLNHVRFHAWCPPEAAFLAADKLGVYLAVEMPLWLNREVTKQEFGDDDLHISFFREEGIKIIESYGDHPSFLCFANGNENLGDFAVLEDYIRDLKNRDDRHFYTMTSNFDHPKSPYEDYRVAFEIEHRKVRNQHIQDVVARDTTSDFEDALQHALAPVISFEVGQYAVYPDVELAEKYTGNMLPVNFNVIAGLLKKNGKHELLPKYLEASGNLAMKLYKEDLEAFMRTKGMGGIQLLSLVDYTGQSTATVGALNIFHEEKPGIPKKEWKCFCGEVVPLFKAKRIFTNKEKLEAEISLYDYGRTPILNPVFNVKIETCGNTKQKRCIYENALKANDDGKCCISESLEKVKDNSMLLVTISVNGNNRTYTNTWRIFVFADEEESLKETEGDSKEKNEALFGKTIICTPSELKKAIKEHKKVIALKSAFNGIMETEFQTNSFIPVFWSPVHFETKAPCGAFIDAKAPVFDDFPTERFADYQWKELLDNSCTIDVTDMKDVRTLVEMVPNFVDNRRRTPLCIIKIDGTEVLFCGFDLDRSSIETKALKKSLERYVLNN